MKRKIFCFLSLLLFIINLNAFNTKLIKKINISEMGILQPILIKVNKGAIYLFDRARYSFFIINDYKLLKTFGKKGQGPGEFMLPLSVGFVKNKIYIYDMSKKLMWFDKKGNYLKEQRMTSKNMYFAYEKLTDNNILTMEMIPTGFMEAERALVFKTKKEEIKLCSSSFSLNKAFNVEENLVFDWISDKNNLFIVPDKNIFRVEVFNFKTRKTTDFIFKKNYKRVKYSEEEIKEMKSRYEKLKKQNPFFAKIKVEFPKKKNAIKDIYTNGKGIVFIITNEKKDNKYIAQVYDTNRNQLGKLHIPNYTLLSVENNDIYLINSNEDNYFLYVYSF